MRVYKKHVFEEIFAGQQRQFEFTEQCVEPVPPPSEVDGTRRLLEPHEKFFSSSPEFRLEEKYQGGLTGSYLAALMLFGRGALVAEEFGDWSDGPDKSITSGLSEEAEHAMRDAYAAYRDAERIVGAYPLAQQTEANRLRKEHRIAKDAAKAKYGVGDEPFHVVRVEPSMSGADIAAATADARAHNARLDEGIKNVREATADISARLDAANDSASSAYEAWLNAMVRQLLQPPPAQTTETPAPVVAAALKPDAGAPEANRPPPKKHRNRKPSWATVAMPYMKALFAAGNYKSGAVFYDALKRRTGEPDSPFKLVNRELYCAEAGTTVSEGSLGNAWPEIRAK